MGQTSNAITPQVHPLIAFHSLLHGPPYIPIFVPFITTRRIPKRGKRSRRKSSVGRRGRAEEFVDVFDLVWSCSTDFAQSGHGPTGFTGE